jgi:hypothetical protein
MCTITDSATSSPQIYNLYGVGTNAAGFNEPKGIAQPGEDDDDDLGD